MTLGDYIIAYRNEHDISLRQFAANADLSPTYISFLEKGRSNTRKKPSPTMDVYKKVAKAVHLSVDDLLRSIDDEITLMPGNISPMISSDEEKLIELFRLVPEEDRQMIIGMIRAALNSKGLL